jgi:hypothetical protein
MTPTIEERLTRYAAQLDAAAASTPPTAPPPRRAHGPHGPARRALVALAGVGVVAAIAATIAIVNHGPTASHPAGTTSSPTLFGDTAASVPPSNTAPRDTPAPTTGPPATAPHTREVVYNPFVGAGVDPALHVTAQASGSCIHMPVGGHNYYRCFANSGGTIYDPCFAGPLGTVMPLVCPRDPTSSDVVTFTATSVTDDATTNSSRPWAMQLVGGRVCRFVSAAWGNLGPYSCTPSTADPPVADCHEPTARAPWWRAECQRDLRDTSPFVEQQVITIWY